jgi:hypothetical protein
MATEAIILCYKEASLLDLGLARLTEFLGIQYRTISLGGEDSFGKLLSCQESSACVMASARSLAAIFHDVAIPPDLVTRLFERVPFVLVYGITPDEQGIYAVRHLSSGLISSVVSFDQANHLYQVSATEQDITNEFSGLAFGPIHPKIDCGLVLGQHQLGFSHLVSINNLPIFAVLKKRNAQLFFLACREIADLTSHTDGSLKAQQYFSRLVPALMFLRYALRDQIWHNPRRYANLTLDDPLLRKSYGFLNYARLLEEMDTCEFTTTIAFIPWNYRRTGASTASLIKARSDRFSICIHGCDHTAGEFACTDVAQLHTQLLLATQRMRAHEQSTGVPYVQAMVFPQGRFSTASLGLLKSHNYLAAVNSSSVPEDLGKAHGLTLADLLTPAVSKYKSFPIFMRRYPSRVVDFAFDLFLGKPALLVEHHQYFQEGYDTIREFITQINSLSKKLQWTNLRELISNTYLQRRISQDITEYKLLTNYQILHNPESMWKQYVILKYEDNEVPIKMVSVDGKQYPFTIEDDHLRLSVDVPPKSAMEVTINYNNMYQYARQVKPLRYNAKVYLRRHLSEVRDNYLCKHDGLLSLGYLLKNRRFFYKKGKP